MAKITFLLLVFCTVFLAGYSKHIHPNYKLGIKDEIVDETQAIPADIDGVPFEMISQIQQSRFVPVNNVFFFKRYPPCEEGFERDLLGVCREVWE